MPAEEYAIKYYEPAGWQVFFNAGKGIMRAGLFVNGDFEKTPNVLNFLVGLDFLVAVDGGLLHIIHAGLTPNVIIGDLDSVDPIDLSHYENEGVDIIRYPVQKDETDLELAVEYVINLGFDELLIFGAIGGRVDHFLGNILLFSNPRFQKLDIKFVTDKGILFFCKNHQMIYGSIGDRVSLIPISEVVKNTNTTGLLYPLINENLYRWKCRGISNQIVDHFVEIHFEYGILLCVHDFYS